MTDSAEATSEEGQSDARGAVAPTGESDDERSVDDGDEGRNYDERESDDEAEDDEIKNADVEDDGPSDGVDYAWVMQTTFVVTILVGAPIVALFSVPFGLPTWEARAEFAIRIGAIVWFVTAIGVAVYEKRYR